MRCNFSALNFVPCDFATGEQRVCIPKRKKKWLLGIIVLVGLLLSACDNQASLPDSVRSLTFSTLTGQKITLADTSGPVLINFWATDCAICIHEMPELTEIYNRYETTGFELIAVAMPYDAPNKVLEMAEREKWPFPVALDIAGEALESFATVKGTPTSYLLDRNGLLVKQYIGRIPMDELRQQLNSLLDLG